MALELVVLTPVLGMALWLVGVFAMRLMLADARVDNAAQDAARAATIARTPREAQAAAAQAAEVTLGQTRPQRQAVQTFADTRGFEAGGSVQVTVRCVLRLSDLGLLGLGGRLGRSARPTWPRWMCSGRRRQLESGGRWWVSIDPRDRDLAGWSQAAITTKARTGDQGCRV